MIKLFKLNKEKTKKQAEEEINIHHNNYQANEIDGVSIDHFLTFADNIDSCQVNALKMAIFVINENKEEKASKKDIIKLLHPDITEFRDMRLKYLLNYRKSMLLELKDLRDQIKVQQNKEHLKEKYRSICKELKEKIDFSIQMIETYSEEFSNSTKREYAFNSYHTLFLYLDHINKDSLHISTPLLKRKRSHYYSFGSLPQH